MPADRSAPRSKETDDDRPDERAEHLELVKEYSAVIEAIWQAQATDQDFRDLVARKRRIQRRLARHKTP